MMYNYSFCKKNGSVKERYKFACQQIVLSKMGRKEIMRGRYDNIFEVYECYTTPRIELCSPQKYRYISKLQEICDNFNVKTREWYSHNDISVDLLGDNVPEMISKIEEILGGDIYIR